MLDPQLDAIKPAGDQSNVVPLPHAGVNERWLRLGSPPELPPELESQLHAETCIPDSHVTEWVAANYRACKRGERGTTREQVYQNILAANNWVPADFDVHQLSRCVQAVSFFASHKTKHGISWDITRNDAPLTTIKGVAVDAIDPAELSAFRAWKAARELSPQRRRARAEQQAANKARLEQQAYIAARFGSAEIRDMLAEPQNVPGMLGGPVPYVLVHERGEYLRQQGCAAQALDFKPLPFTACKPEWWTLSPAGTRHDDRYRRLVAVLIRGEK